MMSFQEVAKSQPEAAIEYAVAAYSSAHGLDRPLEEILNDAAATPDSRLTCFGCDEPWESWRPPACVLVVEEPLRNTSLLLGVCQLCKRDGPRLAGALQRQFSRDVVHVIRESGRA